ncbi:MAG: tetratricopeptide repeat protein [Verrucomicrobia bacterium]|nr:tetratricopeptide repeat protein [Verrucomicrobiota bacterium]MBS0636512.1 tetratricopeptide repeat protein [Verrucomicrobiota bacterium]
MQQQSDATELLLHHYAYSCYNQGQWQKATFAFRQLVELFPTKGNYWYGLGASSMLRGNDEDAAHAFQIACMYQENDPRPYAHWAECSARLGRTDIAKTAIAHAEKMAQSEEFASFLGQVQVIKERIVEVSYARH